MLKPSGHRLDDIHNSIIRKWAKKWKVREAEALRKIIILYDISDFKGKAGTVHTK